MVLALLVWVVWPRATDEHERATYASLRAAPVPPLLLGAPELHSSHATLTADGYTFEAELPNLGHVSIAGRRGSPASGGAPAAFEVRGHAAQVSATAEATTLAWQESTAGYTLTLAGRADAATLDAVAQRVVPLPEATRDAFGFAWDTPLLYLVYLPLLLGFAGWAGGRLLAR